MRIKGHGLVQLASIGQALVPQRKGRKKGRVEGEGGRELSSLRLCVQGMGQTTGILDLRGPQSPHGNLDRVLIRSHGDERDPGVIG